MKKILFIPVIIIVALITIVVVRFSLDKRIDYDVSTNSVTVPKFSEFVLDFEHKLIDSESLPFVASAIIDVDNDGIEELFLGGGAVCDMQRGQRPQHTSGRPTMKSPTRDNR